MSTIKQKVGKCIDPECGPRSKDVPLIAKKCRYHYWKDRASLKADKTGNPAKNSIILDKSAKDIQSKVMGTYFASQSLAMPKYCEESGVRLPTFPAWLKKSCMAHILKKRQDYGFPSVALHPQNMIFLHPDIHTNMDNLGDIYILKMKSLPLMRERVAILLPLLTPIEFNRVPDYFL